MKNTITKTLVFIFFLTFCISANIWAQDTLRLGAMALNNGTEVKLRWAPQDLNALIYGQENGYRVVRYPLFYNGQAYGPGDFEDSTVVLGDFFPLDSNAFVNTGDNRRELVGEFLFYRDSFTVDSVGDPFMNAENIEQRDDVIYGIPLMLADGDYSLAKDMGLAFVDTLVDLNYTYMYEIFHIANDTNVVVDTFLLLVDMKRSNNYQPPRDMAFHSIRLDSTVLMKWSYPTSAEQYSYFDIERSTDQVNYSSIVPDSMQMFSVESENTIPGQYVYQDTVPDTDQHYYYRIRGRTVFGEWGPYSMVEKVVFPIPTVDLLLRIDTLYEIDSQHVELEWAMNMNYLDSIEYFQVRWARDPNDRFYTIGDSIIASNLSEMSFVHENPEAFGNYYRIRAYDAYGHEYLTALSSIALRDTSPPEPPTELEVSIDKKGTVVMSWKPNEEEDIMGYRVFKSNQENGHYVQISTVPVKDTFFVYQIPIDNLSKSIFFKLKALDLHQNTSELSSFYRASKPDVVAPSKPQLRLGTVGNKNLTLEFNPVEEENDIAEYIFMRRNTQTRFWDTLTVLDPASVDTVHFIRDSTASVYEEYAYALMVIDSSGNRSISSELKTRVLFQTADQEISDLVVNGVSNEERIVLSWTYSEDLERLAGFQILKQLPGGVMRASRYVDAQAASIGNSQYVVEVDDPERDRNLQFAIIVEYVGGAMSEKSNVVSITY